MNLPPLYKYLDVQGAKLTLGNRRFKHSRPSDFNDIEDLTIQSIFPEDVEAALTRLAQGFTDVIFRNLDKPPTCSAELKAGVALIQHIYRHNPKAADAIREIKKNDTASAVFDVEHMRARSQAHVKWINDFMQGYRVLCVSTDNRSERMWWNYAQQHQGIALRIEPSFEKDSKFQLFRPVVYRAARPPLYDDTLGFLEGLLFGDQEARIRATLEKIIYAKTLKWQHESEYRLVIPVGEGGDWNTLPYHPEEITELYLGLAMTRENKNDIIIRATAINADISMFQAYRGPDISLTFQRVDL
jgi:hypothetical protein